VNYLKRMGLLSPRLSLAHSVWMDPTEIDEIAAAGANVILNPLGNLKTKSGVPPIRSYLKRGINVALGCDNCSCNDSQSMLQAMKSFAGLAAVEHPFGDTPSATDALHAATASGARALGFADLGSLAPGMKADIALFRLGDIAFVPLNSAVRQLIFGDAAPALDKVIVDGRLVVDEGRLLTIDLAGLRNEAEGYAAELRTELTTITERVKPLFPAIERSLERAHATDWHIPR